MPPPPASAATHTHLQFSRNHLASCPRPPGADALSAAVSMPHAAAFPMRSEALCGPLTGFARFWPRERPMV
jgi:hypothetical protein